MHDKADAGVTGIFTYKAEKNGVVLVQGRKKNTWTDEGATYLIGALDSGRFIQETNLYVALYTAAVTPDATWTAASFPGTASELTTTDPGYSGSRPLWVPDAAASNTISSENNPARFALVASGAGTVTLQGMAILSRDLRGGTQGVLIAAANFTTPLTFPDGTNFDVGWGGTLTPQ